MRADDASSTVPQSIVVSQFREVDRSGAQGPSDESPPVTPSNLDGAVALIQLFGGALNLNIRTAFPSPTPRAGPLPARSFEEVGGSEIALRSQRVLTLGSKQAFEQEAVSDISAIYGDGPHYDRLFGSGHVGFWLSHAEVTGGPILELGCGTGKLSIPLAKAGFSVTGLDNSPALLQFATSKDRNVRWIEGDMRDFDLRDKFALIMLPSNNLCHLHSVEDFQGCMNCVERHLLPGGAFIIDVFVPDLNMLLQDAQDEYLLSEYENPSGDGRVRVMAQSYYERATQIRRTTTVRKIAGYPDQIGTLDLKMYFPRELEALVRLSGFRISARYGGHSGERFSDDSRVQVLVCRHSNQ